MKAVAEPTTVGLISLSLTTHHALWAELERQLPVVRCELIQEGEANSLPKFGARNYIGGILRACLTARGKIDRLIDDSDCSVLLVHTHALIPVLLTRAIRRRRGAETPPLTSVYLSFRSQRLGRLYGSVCRLLNVEGVTFMPDGDANEEPIAQYFRVDRKDVAAIGLATEDTYASAQDRGYIFSGGYTNRDFRTLISAVEGLDYPLVICVVPENDLPRDLPENVRLVYNKSPREFAEWLAGCRIGVIPLFKGRGGAGYTVLTDHFMNAQATIVSDENMDGYVTQEHCRLVQPEDVQELRSALIELMEDDDKRRALGAAGRSYYERRFSPPAVANRLIEALPT